MVKRESRNEVRRLTVLVGGTWYEPGGLGGDESGRGREGNDPSTVEDSPDGTFITSLGRTVGTIERWGVSTSTRVTERVGPTSQKGEANGDQLEGFLDETNEVGEER